MTQILDRSRDFGTVFPPLEGKAFYEQDMKMFGSDGRRVYLQNEIPDLDEPPDRMAAARKAKANKAKQAALNPNAPPLKDAVAEIYDLPPWRRNIQKATFAPKDGKRSRKYPRTVGKQAPNAAPKPATTVKEPQVNLTAWATGEEKLLFGTVKAEIRKRFSVVVNQEHDARAVLIREKVVRAEDIPGYGESDVAEEAAA